MYTSPTQYHLPLATPIPHFPHPPRSPFTTCWHSRRICFSENFNVPQTWVPLGSVRGSYLLREDTHDRRRPCKVWILILL